MTPTQQKLAYALDILGAMLAIALGSAPLMLCMLMLCAARRSAFVARGFRTFRVVRQMPPLLQLVLLPGLVESQPIPATTPDSVAVSAPDGALPLAVWLRLVNDDETAPHLAATGPTRSGKTTLILAALAGRRGALVICTPKPPSQDTWGGVGAVRVGPDLSYQPFVRAVRRVYDEMRRRYAEDDLPAEPITLVLDEYSDMVAEEPDIRGMVLRMWAMGAAAGIRVVVLSTEENVRAWGIEGRGDTRANVLFVRVAPDRSATIRRWGDDGTPIDTQGVYPLALKADLSRRGWPEPGSVRREPGSDGFGHPNAEFAPGSVRFGGAEPSENTLPANRTELTNLLKAISLFDQTGRETDAIEQGFGVTKGGSSAYQRARALFKTATTPR